jgi:MGT family glycosyltransferase
MPKALFFSLPLAGHTNPSLPLVHELTARGTRVAYFSTDGFRQRIEATGAEYRPYRHAFLNDLRALPEQTDQLSWLLTDTTASVLDRELGSLRTERADYVITDSVAPWGQWIGQLLDVPVVTSTSTFAINRRVMSYAVTHGVRPRSGKAVFSKLRHIVKALGLARRLRRRYGVAGTTFMGMVFGQSGLNIVYTSRAFQPCADSFDDRFLFVGPSIGRVEQAEFGWEGLEHPTLVYVSLGTLFNADAGFFRRCLEALATVDCRVVVSLGQQVQAAELGPVPSHVILRREVPQLDVLRRTAVFVTHGGMNSVNESLYFGVPMIAVPQMSEQMIVGRRLEELGAGLCVEKEEASVAALGRAIERVLSDNSFRTKAGGLGETLQKAGGVSRAADAIEKFTAQRAAPDALRPAAS